MSKNGHIFKIQRQSRQSVIISCEYFRFFQSQTICLLFFTHCDTLESSGTKSPGPKVSEQDSLSIHVPNHTMNDPSITMNEMVFNAIKKELSENGKDTFTYQSIEKRMKIEGSDTVRKCIKALLEEGVLENKKKSKKFIGKMQGQLELMKGNYSGWVL